MLLISKVASADIEIVPDEIRELYKNYHIRQLSSLKLNDKESIRKGSFILEKTNPQQNGELFCKYFSKDDTMLSQFAAQLLRWAM
ncbi:hypothetical protein PGT21_033760 [Puccinia graminis f. sp. tritici]|uniref:Uncharacterized protein n=1 Tax=Puccinia graminis f. sp. tritici TaxID=56615 RepID=A0A5B0M0G0_PUCGR|nr:hypothetical protein PGT21_033760 [Puccinia graminis f. sp. tritici]